MGKIIKFGPAGLGGYKQAFSNLKYFHEQGFKACEIAFTYSIYLNKEQAIEIRKAAEKLGISLTIHAPYFINLNSKESKKIEASKKRILSCCKVGNYLGAKYVVFHAAFYQDSSQEDCYQLVKQSILDMRKEIKANKWDITLCPETTGKKSQFGTLKELLQLAKETGCFLCIDFAHLKARNNGNIDYDQVFNEIKKSGIENLHCHFSGIEFTEKGERKHIPTNQKDIEILLNKFKQHNMSGTIINESPDLVNDSILSLKLWNKIKIK